MAHPNVDLLNRGYDAFDKGDLETIRGLFADDIVFHVPGRSQVAGDYRGIDEVFTFFGKLIELTGGTFKIERHTVLADDEHGTVLLRVTAERDGKSLSVNSVDVHHIKDGKVTEFWTFTDDLYTEDEFFG
jgi:ketosteroid isomerase-like protein